MLRRPAFTLVEVLVALSLAAIIFTAATRSSLRQQQVHARVAGEAASQSQLGAPLFALSEQFALMDRDAGDLTPGQLLDTAVQIRSVVGASIACRTDGGGVTAYLDTSRAPIGGFSAPVHAGDTLWWSVDTVWKSAEISSSAPSTCSAASGLAGAGLRLSMGHADSVPLGSMIRVTRQSRYAFYRSSDATWQLGFREWASTTNSFAAPQPIAGPFLMSSDTRRTGLRYFDSAGGEMMLSAVDSRRVARIRVSVLTVVSGLGARDDSVRADSVDIAVQKRHAP